jgi:hypothetical protein
MANINHPHIVKILEGKHIYIKYKIQLNLFRKKNKKEKSKNRK